jgi:uncharacterized protein with HEPN domain
MSRDWTFFLDDILDAAEKVLRYTQGMTFEEFRDNEMVVDAVLRNLEIIGEAAKSLPAASSLRSRISSGISPRCVSRWPRAWARPG